MAHYRGWLLVRPAEGGFAGLPINITAGVLHEAEEEWSRRTRAPMGLSRLIFTEAWLTTTPDVFRKFTPPNLPADPDESSFTRIAQPYSVDTDLLFYHSESVEEVTEELGGKEAAKGIDLNAVVYRTGFSYVPKGEDEPGFRLPEETRQAFLKLARRSDCLILGEVHGTQEVPRLIGALLDDLTAVGYGALGMEIPRSQQEAIMRWAGGHTDEVPSFFIEPPTDGRNNVQTLELFRQAVGKGWQVFCYDVDDYPDSLAWEDWDSMMADTLRERWIQGCPGKKVVAVCGNLHSRLEPSESDPNPPSSFAVRLRERNPEIVVHSVEIHAHGGGCFNGGRPLYFLNTPLERVELREDHRTGHSYVLHLPHASPATFLSAA
jgi:hypothetical protein